VVETIAERGVVRGPRPSGVTVQPAQPVVDRAKSEPLIEQSGDRVQIRRADLAHLQLGRRRRQVAMIIWLHKSWLLPCADPAASIVPLRQRIAINLKQVG